MNFYNPVNVIFGNETRSRLFDIISNKKSLLVCSDTGFDRLRKDPILSKIKSASSDKITVDSSADIRLLSKIVISVDVEFIIAIGGGSVIDSAKIIKHLNASSADIIALPTTAGTGSEVTPYATGWDYHNKKKIGFNDLYPSVAIVDPELSWQLPKSVTISSGLDAINQSFESIWNVNSNQITEILAKRSIKLGIDALQTLSKSEDADARHNMCLASLLSGICISQTKTAICHSMSYPLTVRYDVPHGIACAFTMAEVFKFNAEHDDGRLKEVSKIVLEQTATNDDVYEFIKHFCDTLGVYKYVKDSVKTKDNLMNLVDDMYTPERAKNNVRNITIDDIQNIIEKSWCAV